MSHAAIIHRLRTNLMGFVNALDELIAADDWIDQTHSPLGRRHHCEAARSGALPARKVGAKWLARKADIDAYIEKRGKRPPAERAGVDDAAATAAILEFRAPKRQKRQSKT